MPLIKRGYVWHGYVRVDGITSGWKTTGCRDRTAAEAVLREWERAAANPAYAASKAATVAHAVSAVLTHYAELVRVGKKAADTEQYYVEKLGTVARGLGPERRLVTINSHVIDQYISQRRKEKASEHCISKELSAFKLALRQALRDGQWAGSIDAVFPRFERHYKPRERTLSDDEVVALLGYLPPDYAAQLAFAVATSAEAKCLASAQWTDVSGDCDYVLLRGTKRELRWRTVPIVTGWQKTLLSFALKHAQGDQKKDLLFTASDYGFRSALRKACTALSIDHASPNDLRRTFAVRMREAGFALELIAPLMGHADTKMLSRVYGRLSAEQLRARLLLALNASASAYQVATRDDSKRLNAAHRPTASSSEIEIQGGNQ